VLQTWVATKRGEQISHASVLTLMFLFLFQIVMSLRMYDTTSMLKASTTSVC
jgi:hypothetical protein